ncbi:MAG TPA: agmatinase [Terriglobales bacterium]|nr:agmatinase [Terriglobales bacterium]
MTRYRPPSGVPRFGGITTFSRLPHVNSTEGVDFAVVGVPFDLGASFRTGQRFAPAAVREASRLTGVYHPVHRINVYDHLSGVDFGDAPVFPSDLERSLRSIEEFVSPLARAGVVPIAIGGDHTIPLPLLRALARERGPLALVHFDAHSDTDDTLYGTRVNHGTTFRRAVEEKLIDASRSIQVGMRGSLASPEEFAAARALGFELIEAQEMFRMGCEAVVARIRQRVGDARAYLSFDIDFVDAAYAPGTGTPEVGGPTSREAQEILRGLAGLDFAGFDLVEVLPAQDGKGVTALLAANLIFEFIALLAVRRRSL